jgi:hypothetical protein
MLVPVALASCSQREEAEMELKMRLQFAATVLSLAFIAAIALGMI